MPKTLLLIAQLIGKVEKDSMLPLTMIGLWLSTWDDGFVDVQSEDRLALDCGFTQKQVNRRTHEWRKRVRILEQLGFVEVEPRDSTNISYILIKDPHRAISAMQSENKLKNANFKPLFERLRDKAFDVGAAIGIDSLIRNPSAAEDTNNE